MFRSFSFLIVFAIMSGCAVPNTASVKSYGNLPEALPDTEGELLFVDVQCTVCHGHQGAGNGFLAEGLAASPPDFTNPSIMNSKSDQAIAQAIRNGKGKVMPAYPRLTGSQVNSLVQYIRGLSRDPA
ncbi:MAG: c-type cytochrome [Candidatus Nitronauta litoralis]|uniref:C-type cytochrome n=1 Tax=Candidatus Nitronauta litoralis TaxID=2705533 RepID=A0A7T0BXW7_9BACT|nr:MAG: c-type cytochrome [Candidatus Nitronauta litoralis]